MTGKPQNHAAHHLTATAAVVFVACVVCSLTLAPGSPALATMEWMTVIAAVAAYALYAGDASPRAARLAGFIDERSQSFIRLLAASFTVVVLLSQPRSSAGLAERLSTALVSVAVTRVLIAAHHRRTLGTTDSSEAMVSAIVNGFQRPYDQDVDQ